MRLIFQLLMYLGFSASLGFAQSRFPMIYLDEVGNLGNPFSDEKRQSADLGIARVSPEGASGMIRVEGHDAAGRGWLVQLNQVGGLGWTEVWTADFDANGRKDLLFATHFPGLGRCINSVDIAVLLIDAQGRPAPLEISTMMPPGSKFPFVPVIVRDLDQNGRAEFITTTCERVDPPDGFGESWKLSGVYEARHTQLVPLRGSDVRPYLQVARRIHGLAIMEALPSRSWPDPQPPSLARP